MIRLLKIRSIVLIIAAGMTVLPAMTSFAATTPASTTSTTPTTTTTGSSSQSATQAQHLEAIQTKGTQEIERRLTTLGQLNGKITAATKLTASDKSALTSEVTTEISGLTALKTQLNAETTLAAARIDSQAIYSDYRVYALIVPKIYLIKTADDQQVLEAKIAAIIPALQTNITAAQTAGKDVTALQTDLNNALAGEQAAQVISSAMEAKVITLQPTDYDNDHTILSGDRAQLTTARTDMTSAVTALKAIRSGLEQLK